MFSFFESSFLLSLPVSVILGVLLAAYTTSKVKYKMGWMVAMLQHFNVYSHPGMLMVLLLFFVVFFLNMYSLVPMGMPLTTMPTNTLSVSFIMWAGGYIFCLLNNYKNCVAHFLPVSTPGALQIFLVWIEVLSWLCRPLALGVRLMANITAGHLLLILISQGVFFLGSYGILISVVLFGMVMLEISVSMIQAYVYNLLLSLYMSESLEQ